MLDFWLYFGVLVVLTAAARYAFRHRTAASAEDSTSTGLLGEDTPSTSDEESPSFVAFRRSYLVVYLAVMGADWLQGPYVYALYDSYGFDKSQIAELFIAGFMSSMALGTCVGSLADKFGRKKLSIAFGVFYSASCLTKLFPSYGILMIGRILSGIATSLLFSVFEAWMVSEHRSRGFSDALLSSTFSLATFGNGVVAIVAGLVASFLADAFGYVTPFMVSLIVLIVTSLAIAATWSENYGDSHADVADTFGNALRDMRNDPRIPLLGCISSLFEASMYTFVFMWTPALTADGESDATPLPFGLIFACFMVAVMLGSTVFGAAVSGHPIIRTVVGGTGAVRPQAIGRILLFTAAMALAVPAITSDQTLVFISFLVFEFCCGLYWPCFGTLRGIHVPEATRAAVTNFFRVPLNLLVVVVLIKVGDFQTETVFLICSLWLCLAAILQQVFISLVEASEGTATKAVDDENRMVSSDEN